MHGSEYRAGLRELIEHELREKLLGGDHAEKLLNLTL
jgi:hypothetical protein